MIEIAQSEKAAAVSPAASSPPREVPEAFDEDEIETPTTVTPDKKPEPATSGGGS